MFNSKTKRTIELLRKRVAELERKSQILIKNDYYGYDEVTLSDVIQAITSHLGIEFKRAPSKIAAVPIDQLEGKEDS